MPKRTSEPSHIAITSTKSKDYSYSYKPLDESSQRVIDSVSDLIDDPKYRSWFISRLFRLGPQRFVDLADEARKRGINKGRTFVTMLKAQEQASQ